jgi:hypothetical protein
LIASPGEAFQGAGSNIGSGHNGALQSANERFYHRLTADLAEGGDGVVLDSPGPVVKSESQSFNRRR